MAKATIQDVPQVFIKNPKLLEELRQEFVKFYDQENKPIRIYDSQLQKFNERIHSPEINIDPKLTPKELGIKFEEWFELLNNVQATTTEIPQYEAQTTTTGLDLETKIEQAKKRAEQKSNIQAREKQTVEDFIKQNEERIAKAKSLQEKFKDKVVYAKVVIPDPEKLTQDEQKELEVLVTKAKNDTPVAGNVLTPKQELINDFTIEIEKKLEPVLKDLPEKDREVIARTYAVEIVEKIANPESVIEERVQTVILDNISIPKQEVVSKVLVKDDELISLAKNGAILIATKQKDNFSTLETITASVVGPKLAQRILGQQNIQVVFSDVQSQNETTHIVRFDDLNKSQVQILRNENDFLNTIQQHGQQFGYDKINSVFTNYTGTFLRGKIESLPAGSILKKAYKDPIVQSIFARYRLAEPVVWQAVGQSRFVGLVMKVAPDTAGPVLGLVGRVTGKQLVAPIATKVAGQAAGKAVAGKVAGQVAVKKGFGAVIGKVIGFFTGTPAGLAGWIAGLAIGDVAGRAIQNIWSRVKIWIKENKDIAAPAVGVGTAFFIAPFFGAGPAVVGGVGAFALFGGSVAGLATGVFGVLGFIGRSIGVAIATPVIVTLLVIPPLVAFIMLVINNSAYVVPPDARSLGLNLDNPYVLVTKVANPEKFENPTSNNVIVTYTVTIKALKSPLTKISITDATCKVSKKNASTIQDCPPELENIPPLPADLTISLSSSYSFTFTSEFDSKYADSSIFDTIKIKATVEEKEIETSGSESVCIGDCPHGCFEISDDNEPWPDFGSKLEGATQRLTSEFPSFVDQSCIGREKVKLCYTTSNPTPNGTGGLCNGAIYAITSQVSDGDDRCVVNFNQCVFEGSRTDNDVFFLLTHELSHHIQWRDGGNMINKYENAGGPGELPLCSYTNTADNPDEGSAEANALYANNGVASFSTCGGPINFQSQYPNNYGFAQSYMNNP